MTVRTNITKRMKGSVPKEIENKMHGRTERDKEMNHTQQLPWLVNNILFCYEGKTL